jgi:hypothetical protein
MTVNKYLLTPSFTLDKLIRNNLKKETFVDVSMKRVFVKIRRKDIGISKMSKPNLHTTYNQQTKNWRNISEGASKPVRVYETKAEAQKDGREIAANRQVEHLIHNQDGKISQRNSYGQDNFPPKG